MHREPKHAPRDQVCTKDQACIKGQCNIKRQSMPHEITHSPAHQTWSKSQGKHQKTKRTKIPSTPSTMFHFSQRSKSLWSARHHIVATMSATVFWPPRVVLLFATLGWNMMGRYPLDLITQNNKGKLFLLHANYCSHSSMAPLAFGCKLCVGWPQFWPLCLGCLHFNGLTTHAICCRMGAWWP